LKRVLIIIAVLFINGELRSQSGSFFNPQKTFFWTPTSLTGEIRSEGRFRNHELDYSYLSDTQKSKLLTIGGLLQLKSYLWHPNFLLINIEAEYNPDILKENYIVIPDQSEVRTSKRIQIGGTLFNNKVISMSGLINMNRVYHNRENLSHIMSDTKQYGSHLNFSNKKLPISLSLFKTDWKQEELETGRLSNMERLNFTGRVSKSFFYRDKHEFVYAHDFYNYNYADIYQTVTKSQNMHLTDYFSLDKLNRYIFRSNLSYRKQAGSLTYTVFRVDEDLTIKLPYQFKFQSHYSNDLLQYESTESFTQNFRNSINHQLFLSLNSTLFHEYRSIRHTVYNESDHIYGASMVYTKKIPLKGRINLSYHYQRQNHDNESEPASFEVLNEPKLLTDGQIVLIDRPYADMNSITVRDENGAIIYVEHIDYILIERNGYVEIQRFPGGQISNGSTVYIDYVVHIPETYSFDSNLNRISGSISIFNGLFELYSSYLRQHYLHLENADLLVLNFVDQYRYGFRFDLKYLNAGVEYEDYQSTIVPYHMTRAYISGNQSFIDRLLISVNGNIQKYRYDEENIDQYYTDLTMKVAYRIIGMTQANLDLGYRRQIGAGIDLGLLTGRFELRTQFRQLYFVLGLEKYSKDFLGEINRYNGFYFKLIKRF
jgi:hypothetical protein